MRNRCEFDEFQSVFKASHNCVHDTIITLHFFADSLTSDLKWYVLLSPAILSKALTTTFYCKTKVQVLVKLRHRSLHTPSFCGRSCFRPASQIHSLFQFSAFPFFLSSWLPSGILFSICSSSLTASDCFLPHHPEAYQFALTAAPGKTC